MSPDIGPEHLRAAVAEVIPDDVGADDVVLTQSWDVEHNRPHYRLSVRLGKRTLTVVGSTRREVLDKITAVALRAQR